MSQIDSLYALVLLSGIAGGLGHCLGMCGPLAAALALSRGGSPAMRPLLLYNLGRVTTYGFLGGAVGAAGSLAGTASHLAGIQRGVAVGTGILVAVMGLSVGGWIPAGRTGAGSRPAAISGKLIRYFTDSGSPGAFYPLGMVLGFLPCGAVYTVLLSSARIGMEYASAPAAFLAGALLTALFGLGTVPSLLLAGKAASLAGTWMRARPWLCRLAGASMVAAGIVFAARGL